MMEPPKAFQPDPHLKKLAQDLLDGVNNGSITSMACIIVSPLGELRWPGVGRQLAEMFTGADMMQDDMKAAMRGQSSGKILRPGG